MAILSTAPWVDVVGCMDKRYARHFAAVLASAFSVAAFPERLRFWLVSAEDLGEARTPLEAIANKHGSRVTFLTLDISRLASAPTNAHISLASYYRVLLPEILPTAMEKFIYLDADLVVRRDLSELFAEELDDDEFVAAVVNPRFRRWEALGMQPEMGYFNAGVLLVNLRLWRKVGMTEQLIQFIQNNTPVLKQHDQDTLNAVFCGRWRRLDLRWNQQYSFFLVPARSLGIDRAQHKLLLRSPYIVHYSGGSKPWSFADDHPMREDYYRALDQTTYSGWRPDRTSLKDWLRVIQRFPVPHRLRPLIFRW
jgi:lipopolysaccharide biosynthesis glycosyltransferase